MAEVRDPQAHARCLSPTLSRVTVAPRGETSFVWKRRILVSLTYHPGLLFQIIRKALSEEKRVSTKTSAADLVTETDHLVEDLIISELQKRFPSHR